MLCQFSTALLPLQILPDGPAELRDAREKVDAETPPNATQDAQQVEERILLQSDDPTMALARTRIDIERLLRDILGKPTSLTPSREETLKFASIAKLFNLLVFQYPKFAYLQTPFKYVIQVCNAAIHAQRVTDEQASEALALGAQIIAALKAFADGKD